VLQWPPKGFNNPYDPLNFDPDVVTVLQWPPKGFNNPYDPLNFDPDVCREYGGYMEEGGRGGGGGGGGGRFSDR